MNHKEVKRRKEQRRKDSLMSGTKPMMYFRLAVEILVIILVSTSAYALYAGYEIIKG